jgi:hypothetical protein
MSCPVMGCHVMSCPVMGRDVMSCDGTGCHVMSCDGTGREGKGDGMLSKIQRAMISFDII